MIYLLKKELKFDGSLLLQLAIARLPQIPITLDIRKFAFNTMIHQVNKTLHPSQLEGVLKTLFIELPVKILRFIPSTGRSGVVWVYLENEISATKRATFLSFADVLEAFSIWIETLNMMALAIWQRLHISMTIWSLVEIDDLLHHKKYGWVNLVEKQRSQNGWLRFWIETKNSLEIVEPWEIEVF